MTISDDEDSGDEKKEKEKDKPTVKVNPDDDSDNDDPTSSLKCDPTGKKYNIHDMGKKCKCEFLSRSCWQWCDYSQFHTEFSGHVPISSESSRIETLWPIIKHSNNVTYIKISIADTQC